MTTDHDQFVAHRVREIEAFEARADNSTAHHDKRNQKGQFMAGWNDQSARQQAKASGKKRYMGKPCKYGHSGERYVRNAECCECKRLQFAAWTEANRDSYNAYARRYYHAQPPEKLKKSRAEFAASRKAWEAANREIALANRRKYWLANRERWRVYVRNRRARVAGTPGWHSVEDIIALRAKQNDRCKFCGIDLRGVGEVDHITPVSRGGTNWPHNLQLLCMPCNRRKHAKDPVAHAREIGLLPAAPAADGAQQEV